jgi:hypothetical protein
MPDRIPPPDDHPAFLTTSAERTVAAQAIHTAAPGTDLAVCAVTADTLDLMSGATLIAVGVTDPYEQRAMLAILWGAR